jgi:hypothetical protein
MIRVTTDLNTLLTALYVKIDDEIGGARCSGRPPYLPQRPGYHKRLKAALPLLKRMIRELAMDSDFWTDTVWIADSTSVPCGMSRPTVQRSNSAGWAGYGYCASHSRFFWGLRLYLVCFQGLRARDVPAPRGTLPGRPFNLSGPRSAGPA